MKKLIPALAATALALAASLASAQMPQHERGAGPNREAMKERMTQRMEARQKMHEACSGKRGEELGNCMKGQRTAMMQQRMELRQKAHEACNGKRGDELMGCLREQREKSGFGRPGARG